ncbi:MAG: hypothetical protein IJJ34_10805 [Clostridia bacterium]|nr:hypothetical protein [Clostridia bacterium]
MKKQEVISIMQDQYCEIFGKEPPPTDENLMSPKLGNYIIDYLYWIERIEEQLGVSVSRLIEMNDYSVMSMENLAEMICNDTKEE